MGRVFKRMERKKLCAVKSKRAYKFNSRYGRQR
nr:MAG TPA: hypothetical protein [Caudoviricetes sp.]